jgi:hypothetical protein
MYGPLLSGILATCSAHRIFVYLTILTAPRDMCKSGNSSAHAITDRTFLRPPLAPTLLLLQTRVWACSQQHFTVMRFDIPRETDPTDFTLVVSDNKTPFSSSLTLMISIRQTVELLTLWDRSVRSKASLCG